MILVVTVVWQVFVRVPFIPTPAHIAEAMIDMVPWRGGETVVDLGAGDGSLLEAVKSARPDVNARGCEIVPTVWLLGMLRAFIKRTGVRLRLGSALREDISKADVIFLYLFPELMDRLAVKFDRELKPGTIVVSQTFGFAGRTPEKTIRVPRLGATVQVFLYRW